MILTDNDLRKLANDVRGNGWLSRTDMYDKDTYLVDTLDGDALASAFDELLTVREAVAPQMAEVDALVKQIEAFPHVNSYEGAKKLATMLRQAILVCEKEKQRADEAESKLTSVLDHDEGLLGGDASWSVEQWHDYIRSIIGRIQGKAWVG